MSVLQVMRKSSGSPTAYKQEELSDDEISEAQIQINPIHMRPASMIDALGGGAAALRTRTPSNISSAQTGKIPSSQVQSKSAYKHTNQAYKSANTGAMNEYLSGGMNVGFMSPTSAANRTQSMGRAGTSWGFRPRRRQIDVEMPHLRRKYEGGYWGYAKRATSEMRGAKKCNTKVLLSHTKNSNHDFSFNNFMTEQEEILADPMTLIDDQNILDLPISI